MRKPKIWNILCFTTNISNIVSIASVFLNMVYSFSKYTCSLEYLAMWHILVKVTSYNSFSATKGLVVIWIHVVTYCIANQKQDLSLYKLMSPNPPFYHHGYKKRPDEYEMKAYVYCFDLLRVSMPCLTW